MKPGIYVTKEITIPENELEVTTSRAGGPGGQHVNKTDTRITVRWNVRNSAVLNDEQKEHLLDKLQAKLTADGDLIVHNSESKSQLHNKKAAFSSLAERVRRTLYMPKKRHKTRISYAVKEKRLASKSQRGELKKTRSVGGSSEE